MCTCLQPWGSILPAPPCPAHPYMTEPPLVQWQPQTWTYTLAPEPTPEHPMVARARKYVLRGGA